jgi:hypothetical protein
MTSYIKALELKGELLQEIGYQEKVLENAGECYDGHYKDIDDCKKLLSAVDTFLSSVKQKNKED